MQHCSQYQNQKQIKKIYNKKQTKYLTIELLLNKLYYSHTIYLASIVLCFPKKKKCNSMKDVTKLQTPRSSRTWYSLCFIGVTLSWTLQLIIAYDDYFHHENPCGYCPMPIALWGDWLPEHQDGPLYDKHIDRGLNVVWMKTNCYVK